MIKYVISGDFDEQYRQLIHDNPDMKISVLEKILLFRKNPDDSRLYNHKLIGKLKGRWAFSITDDVRIIYKWLGKSYIRLLGIGTHAQVYPKKLKS